MRINPKTPSKVRTPFAIIRPGYRCVSAISSDLGEMGATGPNRSKALLDSLSGHTCYVVGGLPSLRHSTGARVWEANVWRGKITSLSLDGSGTKVSSLRGVVDDTPEGFRALSIGLSWLSDLGICSGSLSSMAWNLWRSTLSKPLSIAFAPKVGRAALYGGRQEIRSPRTYQHMKSIDITAAYPYAMITRPYASTLREVSADTAIDGESSGMARASVLIPDDLRFAPLPVRIGPDLIQWQRGRIEGVWSWTELDAAAKVGADVKVLRSWAPVREVEPFGEWWKLVLEGRALPDGAAAIVKAISSTLWGLFGMVGDDRGRLRWSDDAGESAVFVPNTRSKALPHAQTAHFAAETASRVRRRMLLEGLAGPFAPIHVDTDGIIVRKSSPMPADSGDGPGQWRQKASMVSIDVKAPQVYRYLCSRGCDKPHGLADRYHYVTAGIPSAKAAAMFDRMPETKIAIYGRDMVIPTGYAGEDMEIDKMRIEASAVQSYVFGRPMAAAR